MRGAVGSKTSAGRRWGPSGLRGQARAARPPTRAKERGWRAGRVAALAVAVLLPVVAMMVLLPWRGTAHGQGPIAFGIQPAGSGAGDPGAYFAYSLEAGA